jgi:hypothetical protein
VLAARVRAARSGDCVHVYVTCRAMSHLTGARVLGTEGVLNFNYRYRYIFGMYGFMLFLDTRHSDAAIGAQV